MVSIERTPRVKKRFEANRPFAGVDLMFEQLTASSQGVTSRSGGRPNLVWLDYDKPISKEMLSDVAEVVQRTGAFSVLIVTVWPSRAATRRRESIRS